MLNKLKRAPSSLAEPLTVRAERVAKIAERHADACDRGANFPEEAVAALKAEAKTRAPSQA